MNISLQSDQPLRPPPDTCHPQGERKDDRIDNIFTFTDGWARITPHWRRTIDTNETSLDDAELSNVAFLYFMHRWGCKV